MTKILECEKNGFKKHLRALFRANFLMFVLLISNHTVFLVLFGIHFHLRVFQKADTTFLKDSLVQINSKLNSKPYDYLWRTSPANKGGQFDFRGGRVWADFDRFSLKAIRLNRERII